MPPLAIDRRCNVAGVKYHYYDHIEPNESQLKRDNDEVAQFIQFIHGVNEKSAAKGVAGPVVMLVT